MRRNAIEIGGAMGRNVVEMRLKCRRNGGEMGLGGWSSPLGNRGV